MDYELVKHIKDSGFPVIDYRPASDIFEGGFVEPTLSELIEACGEVEFRIHCYPKGFGGDVTRESWFVIERPNLSDMPRCSTPSEAVARLYLALNKPN